MKESDLYPILEKYYTDLGYDVKGEVCGCDLVAMKGDEIIIIELKLFFNVKLLYQAVRRLAITSQVFVAIPKPITKQKISFWTMTKSLTRRLELGLIIINGQNIKIQTKPSLFNSKMNSTLKKKLITEFKGRKAGHNIGGVTGAKLQTAYLEHSIQIVTLLHKYKKQSAKQLRELGATDNTYRILYNNHYGWFEKKDKGIYGLRRGSKTKVKKLYPIIWDYYDSTL